MDSFQIHLECAKHTFKAWVTRENLQFIIGSSIEMGTIIIVTSPNLS